jgi:hypothetical protein
VGVDVLSEVVIDRPLAVVVDYAADPTNAPEWYVNIESVEWRMTLRNRGEPSGFATVAAPLLAGAMRRANQNDLARLKALLESR